MMDQDNEVVAVPSLMENLMDYDLESPYDQPMRDLFAESGDR